MRQVAVLVNGAALDRHTVPNSGDCVFEPWSAINDEELGPPQATLSSTARQGLGALATHAFDREQHLLSIGAHADIDEQRDRGRCAIEPHPHHGAVENEPHDRLIGQRAGIPGVPVGPSEFLMKCETLHNPKRPI